MHTRATDDDYWMELADKESNPIIQGPQFQKSRRS